VGMTEGGDEVVRASLEPWVRGVEAGSMVEDEEGEKETVGGREPKMNLWQPVTTGYGNPIIS
jgi:hypothetical protein